VGKIKVLPPELASQIAAGEVVERPSSAVKELVENAIDAGASRCDIEIAGGGISLIAVQDDGTGMSEEDAVLALERHATSKIRSLAELTRVASFGFRGEALPSIASVSRCRLVTRQADQEAGTELCVEGGIKITQQPVGASVGTRIEISDLFYNVPARRKFLRASNTESGHVAEVVEQAALASPGVTFTLKRDGRQVREFLRARDRAERVRQVEELDLGVCRGTRGPLTVEAYLSRPEKARPGATGLSIVVNDRPVRDRAVAVTIAQAYGSVLERGRYPRGVVFLDLPPELVDVNVHPQKAEVRFADPRAVTDALYGIVSREIGHAFSLPSGTRGGARWAVTASSAGAASSAEGTTTEVAAPPERKETERHLRATEAERPVTSSEQRPATEEAPRRPEPARHEPKAAEANASPQREALTQAILAARPRPRVSESEPETAQSDLPLIAVRDSSGEPFRPKPELRWSSLRFVAQLRHTYLFCESDNGLYILDQHAAAERVTFTRLRRAYRARTVASQALLFPLTLDVSAAEVELVEKYAARIAEVGIDLRPSSHDLLTVHAVPKLLKNASPERLARDLLSELARSGGRGFSDAVDLALATMACHGSIRAGDPLTREAAVSLLEALDDADFAGHCPHGRPVVAFNSWAELERKVGRR
jgi:DNA mismatch repair protein MutL